MISFYFTHYIDGASLKIGSFDSKLLHNLLSKNSTYHFDTDSSNVAIKERFLSVSVNLSRWSSLDFECHVATQECQGQK